VWTLPTPSPMKATTNTVQCSTTCSMRLSDLTRRTPGETYRFSVLKRGRKMPLTRRSWTHSQSSLSKTGTHTERSWIRFQSTPSKRHSQVPRRQTPEEFRPLGQATLPRHTPLYRLHIPVIHQQAAREKGMWESTSTIAYLVGCDFNNVQAESR
jgi:hypothetical protein